MRIRKWAKSDIEQLSILEVEIFETPWDLHSIESAIKLNTFRGYIIENNEGEIVGYYGYSFVVPEADLETVAVISKERGNGYGNIILEHFIKECEEKEILYQYLEVREDNDVAKNLYKKYGFINIGKRKNYYGKNKDAIVMERKS